ncbi:esterase family protein [Angustibacter sp. Root456]|uniref:alpha/beta hydrolase n=1 Tax=Angustibacter sp. Root456 TaxID=1736539 RepID=UPI00070106F3|nr:alpha/beta hydrolase-fold protein [Angustibacter sp. Root456]KQX65707.1 hypothetical protein ASD06_08770 [Angustibacter sp. Root456]
MSLLGRPLLVLLTLLAVGLPVATALVWNRLGRRRVVRWSARTALLVVTQLSAVLVAGAALNDYGYFYGSWSELFAAGASSAPVRTSGGPSRTAAAGGPAVVSTSGIRIVADVGARTPAQWARVGRTLAVRIFGAASQLASPAYVWLPPQYFAPGRARAFPAVEVLGGYPGSALGLVRHMDYPGAVLAEVGAHRAAPVVLVMLRPAVVYPRDTECTNVPAGPQVETFLAQDLPAAIDAGLRVRPTAWGVMGDSTGGYCATKITMDHFDRFRAGVALSGYFTALHDRTTGDLWGGSSTLRHLNDLEWRLRHQPPPPTSLFIAISRDERGPNGYADTRRFLALVHRPLQVTTMVLASGGHNFGSWGREMGPAIDWLSARLGGSVTAVTTSGPPARAGR